MNPRLVYITTPGRCGSSFLMNLISCLGHKVMGAWDLRTSSGFEDPEVLSINSQIMLDLSVKSTLTRSALVSGELSVSLDIIRRIRWISRQRRVVKDADLFLEWQILDTWNTVTDLSIIFLWRDPMEQWLSWCRTVEAVAGLPARQRFESFNDSEEYVNRMLLCRDRFLERVFEYKLPMQELRYPDFTKEPEQVYCVLQLAGLTGLGTDNRISAYQQFHDAWSEVFDPSKVHSTESETTSA